MNKEIIILTKSSKHDDYCIAGIDTTNGEWIRPVSPNKTFEGAVPLRDIVYKNGSAAKVFDKVQIEFLSHSPTDSQPENYAYDSAVKWVKTGESSLSEVIRFRGYDKPEKIFYNNSNVVLDSEVGGESSLLLVDVKNSYIFIKTFPDNRKLQFNFLYNNIEYKYFKISDIAIKNTFIDEADGRYNYKDELPVVFSLTDKYNLTGKYYKMVAQMFY